MEKALSLVGGSFVAAAKLLDMTPQRFRNLIHGHANLKAKWGKRRGRPAETLAFYVSPYTPPQPELPPLEGTTTAASGFRHVLHLRAHIMALPAKDQAEMGRWLERRVGIASSQ